MQRARRGRAQGRFCLGHPRKSVGLKRRVLVAADEQRTMRARSGRAVGSRSAFRCCPTSRGPPESFQVGRDMTMDAIN